VALSLVLGDDPGRGVEVSLRLDFVAGVIVKSGLPRSNFGTKRPFSCLRHPLQMQQRSQRVEK